MLQKMMDSIVAVGRRHKRLRPLFIAALALLFVFASVGEACASLAARCRRTGARRLVASALAVCMVFTLMPMNAFAAQTGEEQTGGLCEHHPVHTEDCGYVEAVKGHACKHVHTADCYTDELTCEYIVDEDEDQTASDSDAGHVHTQECYELDCPHARGEHDGDCGYMEAVPGQPCTYVCAECAKEPVMDKVNGTASGNDLNMPEIPPQEGGQVVRITGFDPLDAEVQNCLVPAGTEWDALALPGTLGASGYTVADDVEPVAEAMTVEGVTWEIDPENPANDGNSAYDPEIGSYCLTPVLPQGYELENGAELPEIYVMIDGQADTLTYDETIYSKNDVDVINRIITEKGGLTSRGNVQLQVNDPKNWEVDGFSGYKKVVTWSSSSPKRITELDLSVQNITGKLDLSGLTSLTYLKCNSNQLTSLDSLGSLTALTSLDCGVNQLTSLDGLGSLRDLDYLNCSSNQLTGLNGLENLTALTLLFCENNELRSLDVSAQSRMGQLRCGQNPLTTVKLPEGKVLTVGSATGGTVEMDNWYSFDNTNIAVLKATADEGLSLIHI